MGIRLQPVAQVLMVLIMEVSLLHYQSTLDCVQDFKKTKTMNMKNRIKYIFLSAAVGLLLISSCSKKLDEAYQNPNSPIRVPVETILPSLIGNFVGSGSA